MQEEIFGPILPVKTYRDLDKAIAYISGKPLKPPYGKFIERVIATLMS